MVFQNARSRFAGQRPAGACGRPRGSLRQAHSRRHAAFSAAEGRQPRRRFDEIKAAASTAAAPSFARSGHRTTGRTGALHVGHHLETQNLTHFYHEALASGLQFPATVQPCRSVGGAVVFETIVTQADSRGGFFDTIVAAIPGLPRTVLSGAIQPRAIMAAFPEGHEAGARA